ncbi:hypothetical protein JW721_03860 [Candidatus Micrarchaeota archaeon]|nr:hypothetical protein [Candidatus Micrarchaeota archaeon]
MKQGKFDLSFLHGKGVIAGEGPIMGVDAREFSMEPGNLYTLLGHYEPESLDFVISKNFIFKSKYHRILLKEWMNACRVGGDVVILLENRFGGPANSPHKKGMRFLLLEIFALFGNSVEVDHEYSKESGEGMVRIRKKEPALAEGDSVTKWTFGILSNGKRNDEVDRIIEAIISQGIPKVQIIVCGKYENKNGYEIDYLPFSEKDRQGWITRKKNMVMENAKYENVVVVHDRVFPSRGWYAGMKKYGNYFDALSCVLVNEETGKREGDWIANIPMIAGHLDYSDWDEKVRINGPLIVLKKSAWKKAPWNEHLFWNEAEDFELGERQNRAGVLLRFNPYSKCTTPGCRFKYMEFEKDTQKLGKLKVPIPQDAYLVALNAYLRAPAGVRDGIKKLLGR